MWPAWRSPSSEAWLAPGTWITKPWREASAGAVWSAWRAVRLAAVAGQHHGDRPARDRSAPAARASVGVGVPGGDLGGGPAVVRRIGEGAALLRLGERRQADGVAERAGERPRRPALAPQAASLERLANWPTNARRSGWSIASGVVASTSTSAGTRCGVAARRTGARAGRPSSGRRRCSGPGSPMRRQQRLEVADDGVAVARHRAGIGDAEPGAVVGQRAQPLGRQPRLHRRPVGREAERAGLEHDQRARRGGGPAARRAAAGRPRSRPSAPAIRLSAAALIGLTNPRCGPALTAPPECRMYGARAERQAARRVPGDTDRRSLETQAPTTRIGERTSSRTSGRATRLQGVTAQGRRSMADGTTRASEARDRAYATPLADINLTDISLWRTDSVLGKNP